MDFYGRVRQLAKERKYASLQEFIISVGLNHDSYYSRKRAGNLPQTDESVKIAQALGTTVEYLVLGNAPKPLTADETLNEIQVAIEKYRKNAGLRDRKKLMT